MTETVLEGDALEERARELDIAGRSTMTADQKREAIAAAEAETDPPEDDPQGGRVGAEAETGDEPDDSDDLDDEEDEDTLASLGSNDEAANAQNQELEHTEGGATTRDAHDQGVPMLQGEATESVGPEDALGVGEKRGDYADRMLPSLNAHEVVPVEGVVPGQPVTNEDGGVDIPPHSRLERQVGRVLERGQAPGQKGGVDTDPRHPNPRQP